MGVLETTSHSQGDSSIEPFVKSDNSIRICEDYKVTVDSLVTVDQFSLPNPEG